MSFSEYVDSPEFKRGATKTAEESAKYASKVGYFFFKGILSFIKEFFAAITGR